MTTFRIEKGDKIAFKGMFAVWQNCDYITHIRATGIRISIHNDFVRVAFTVGKKKKTEIAKFFVKAKKGDNLRIDESVKKYVTLKDYYDGATMLMREDSKN
jgi:hypothetical protein